MSAGIKTTIYSDFKGVDFTTDASLVSKSRSPWATNMIADVGGRPEKRPGWRTLHTLTGKVNGLFEGSFGGAKKRLAHVGTKLYEWSGEPALVMENITDADSTGIFFGGKIWILTGREYIVYDGTAAKKVSENAYVPTTIITREPTGGGTSFESLNLAGRFRKNDFQTNGTAKTFQLDAANLDADTIKAWVWGVEKTEGTDFTADRAAGTVTFSTAPSAPASGKADGLTIQFAKTVEGYLDRIGKCRIMTSYGVGTSDRLVFSGNPDFPNLDWTSGLNDPTYIPDLSYSNVGTEGVPIMGYCRIGEYLGIVKADNGQDSTVFIRSASAGSDGQAVFPLRQAIAGVGAVSMRSFGQLLDEPLFLSDTGVFAVTTNVVTSERICQNRSFFVNGALTNEPNLKNARGVAWLGMYMLAVNGHIYILDGRQQKTYRSESLGDYVYECYYWDNVPVNCWLVDKDSESLFFGTADGRICRFNTDIDAMSRYSDDGAAITALWATKADDDGDSTREKTMIKKGCAVTLKPYTRSSAKICVRSDRDTVARQVNYGTLDIFDWADIDFSRFTFNANDGPQEIMFRAKVKKYKRLQIIIKNDAVNEGFGVYGITKHYITGNFAKR